MTITCADCGSAQLLPEVPPRAVAECHRCDRVLERRAATHLGVSMAAATAMLVLLPFAAFLPLMRSTIRNLVFESSRLITSVPVIYQEVWFPFALGFLLFAVLLPGLRALALVVVLGSIRWGWPTPELGRIFRWNQELRVWSMTDVVVVAGVATYFRAAAPADVDVLLGAWCYMTVAALALTADLTLDRRKVWNAIFPDLAAPPAGRFVSCGVCELAAPGMAPRDPCPRCGAALDRDVTRRFVPSLMALAAAIPLTAPAYDYAVIVNDQLMGLWEFTILGTVQLMADRGLWLLGFVLLVAGVVIPVVELVGFGWLFARVRFPERKRLVERTRTYRLLRSLVRWPMVIPFIAAIAAPIVDFPGIDDILAGPGATPFFLLVVLLVLVVRTFEPRLMWRAAGEAPEGAT
ncbi:MAG TPA: paraquat-inducible protein A [Thermoanaerobaculia bacterium]|nr:paraquat-inducible protein A [Thermoanaerobaculia bacterium]